jgi:branched-chain amino acid transport system substrate-binding protein
VTADTIKLGRHTGITGFLASYEPGWGPTLDALIRRVNEAGGIHGRNIELVTRDDKSTPQDAVVAVRDLVDNQKVFALYFGVGAPAHSSVHEFHVAEGVPYLLFFDSSGLGVEPTSKWDIAYQSPDTYNGIIMARVVAKESPGAKIAIVYADYPAPVAAVEGIRFEAPNQGLEIVGEFSHDVTQAVLTSQAQQVAETDADWVIYEGFDYGALSLIKSLRENVGWEGKIAQFGAITGESDIEEALDGTINTSGQGVSEQWDPDLPPWDALKVMATEEGYDYSGLNTSTFGAFEILVRALELAGPDLTREGLMEAFDYGFTLQDNWTCNVCSGAVIMGPQDHWPSEFWRAGRWDNATKTWELIDSADFETSRGLGLRGTVSGYECEPPSADAPEGTCPWEEGG